jgi:hypothetical protein
MYGPENQQMTNESSKEPVAEDSSSGRPKRKLTLDPGRAAVLAGIFTAAGAIGASIIGNWQHLFGRVEPQPATVSVQAGGDSAIAGNVSGTNIQENHGTISIGKGSEFYRKNGFKTSLPQGYVQHGQVSIGVALVNHSERRIHRAQALVFPGSGADAIRTRPFMATPEFDVGPHEMAPYQQVRMTGTPPAEMTMCTTYEADDLTRFVTVVVQIGRPDPLEQGSLHYRTTSDYNVFYSDRHADCGRSGHTEAIAVSQLFE